ncbi:MAG: methyltransferase domain-containing protein [Bacteroidota bacterium]
MKTQKQIKRDGQKASAIFDNRSLDTDYRTLRPLLKTGLSVLDVGCGTGAISKDIAQVVGPGGKVVGIDKTSKFIEHGKQAYQAIANLELLAVDLFDFEPQEGFDLIVAARALQWFSHPKEALLKMKTLLKPNGQLSILDYNHNQLEWQPQPPKSMLSFYQTFLKWRADAGMNNGIAADLPEMMKEVGFHSISVLPSNEHYERSRADFQSKVGIWSKVAGSTQMVEEGYLEDDLRRKAIEEYNDWVAHSAVSMTMKLSEVRGRIA